MIDMAQRQILPAALHYSHRLCTGAAAKQTLGASSKAEIRLITRLSEATDALSERIEELKAALAATPQEEEDKARHFQAVVLSRMNALRKEADLLEELTDKTCWPYPTYSDLLFY